VLRAIRAGDSAGAAMPWPPEVRGELVAFLSVGTGAAHLSGDRHPVARLATPVLALSSAVWPMPENVGPRYPAAMKAAGLMGKLRVDFVVDERGHPVPGTVRVREFSFPEFAQAVLEVLPRARFYPSTVGGCPIRALVTQPFEFELTR
jgi:TonB family protein